MVRKRGGKNNAITHGAFARDLILDDESGEEFDLLWNGLIEEWAPAGTLEEETVGDIAQCIWAKRRSDRFFLQEVTYAQEHPDDDRTRRVLKLRRMLDGVERLEEATEIIGQLPPHLKVLVERTTPRSKFEDHKSWVQGLQSRLLGLCQILEKYVSEESLDPAFLAETAANVREVTAKKIALDERLDARIDKAIKRLAQLKAFKQILEDRASHARGIDHRISDQRPTGNPN